MGYIQYFDKFRNMTPYLEIGEEEWSYIKDTFDMQDVKESLAKIAMEYPPPYKDISEQDAKDSFMRLKGVHWYDYIEHGEWFVRGESDWPLTFEFDDHVHSYLRRFNAGIQSSDFFHQENRWRAESVGHPGPLRTWETEAFMTTLFGCAYSLDYDKITKGNIRTMIALRKYICSQFKPNVAKMIYEMFDAKKVLDFSAGWGDRLAGFYACQDTELYVGIDPKTDNHPIYRRQADFYDSLVTWFETKKRAEFICSPAEDADLSDYEGTMDLIFTSPPYFNVERYSNEDTQSWVRYGDMDQWLNGFLFKTIDNVIPTLKSGGHLIINIADISRGGQQFPICNWMNDYLDSHSDMCYIGALGMEMAARPNSGGAATAKNADQFKSSTMQRSEDFVDKAFCEPCWIWRKA